ncbi:MAG: DUF1926 domain-containing protein [Nitrososphaerota archaeon]|nr:DUF1926 domain-containing protein [Nitrososphaerota archaeon]
MKPLDFALVIHNHQPVDNKDEVIEMIYNKSYLPFIEILSKHPQVKANLHYTGSLLDWLESYHPELIYKIKSLVARGQVEMLGGGYYEPILAVIPDSDSIGQLTELSQKIARLFGIQPNGCWMAERAWEPQLPEILDRSKIKYTLLDEVMLSLSGISDSGCFEPYLVESRGKYTTIFPILRTLRKSIPYKSVGTLFRYLKQVATTGGRLAVYADDGEKFGAWPHSYEIVYKQGWLESFLSSIEKNSEWLNTVLLSDYLKRRPPETRTYLSCASYPELMDWSLPASSKLETAKGFWRLFLAKYPESARMYSKMLQTSEAVHSLGDQASTQMLHELWKGQCNDAYWHGVFGGLYLAMLRRITYTHLIEAQKLVEAAKHKGSGFIEISKASFDGHEEFLVNSEFLGILASPKYGGSLVELDYKPKSVNLFDNLARRQERYHNEVHDKKKRNSSKRLRSIHSQMAAKEKGLRNLIVFENGHRFSFLDHILKENATPSDIQSKTNVELCSPYGPYIAKTEESAESARIDFTRTCKLQRDEIALQKRYAMRKSSSDLEVSWAIACHGKRSYVFSPEINLSSLGDQDFAKRNSKPLILKQTRRLELSYPEFGVSVDFDFALPTDIWQIPINTVSKSESGYERTLQCVSIMPRYAFDGSGRLDAYIRLNITN